MHPGLVFLFILIGGTVLFLAIFLPIFLILRKYKEIVRSHSLSFKTIKEIEGKYDFNPIPNFNMYHSYDNENFYSDISCHDYLTYELVYLKKDVLTACEDAEKNHIQFEKMLEEAKNRCELGKYDCEVKVRFRKVLDKIEEKLCFQAIPQPQTRFTITVQLTLTNINGVYRRAKASEFDADEIKAIIHYLNQKRGDFYLDRGTYEAIARVERGKVSNRMRFAIYKRDGYRCRKCGRTTDLEIDHIIPIAKGGKTTMSNLQTLCHRCNQRKGDRIEY